MNGEAFRPGDNYEVMTGAAPVISSTCGYGEKGSAPRCHSPHSLSTHVVAAAVRKPCNHGDALLLRYPESLCDRGVSHSDSVEVKISDCIVPAHSDRGRVDTEQMEGTDSCWVWKIRSSIRIQVS